MWLFYIKNNSLKILTHDYTIKYMNFEGIMNNLTNDNCMIIFITYLD